MEFGFMKIHTFNDCFKMTSSKATRGHGYYFGIF